MQDPLQFYKNQLASHSVTIKDLFKQLSLYSVLRLMVFTLTAAGIYFTYEQWQIAVVIGVLGVAIFLVSLSKYTDLKTKRALYKRLLQINEDELKIASGDFHQRVNGLEFQNPKHYYSLDIDLFGKGSFFQYINRTALQSGTQKLSSLLLANNISDIKQRQDSIKELAQLPEWRQRYSALAQGIKVEHSAESIIHWLKQYQPFLTKIHYNATLVFSVLSVVFLGLGITKIIPIAVAGYWLFLGLAITALFLKKINQLAQHTSKTKATFRQYALLLKEIETIQFQSEQLKLQQQRIQSKSQKASQIFMKFSKALDALDN